MTKLHSILIPLVFASISPLNAAIVEYNDRSDFLAALTLSSVSTDFSNLAPGDAGTSQTLFADTPGATLLLESRDAANLYGGNNLWVSDTGNLETAIGATTSFDDQLRISSNRFFAIAADWFLGNEWDDYVAGSVVLTFSDNSTYTITSSSQSDSFRGYISDSPLTSVLVSSFDPTNVAAWVTVDNVTTAVPEPSALLLTGLAGLGTVFRRRRNA